jgi:hypothetical protein
MAKTVKNWEELMERVRGMTPKPILASKDVVNVMHEAFPWARKETLEWLSERLSLFAASLVNVLEEKFTPKFLHPCLDIELKRNVAEVLFNYVRDDMELWVNRIEPSDLLTEQEIMSFGKQTEQTKGE